MNYQELKDQARRILDAEPTGEFEAISFSLSSGGIPVNKAVDEEDILFKNKCFKYETQYCGNAYRGEITVAARLTDLTDLDGECIYESRSGKLFIYKYERGTPEHFDSGSLEEPRFPSNPVPYPESNIC